MRAPDATARLSFAEFQRRRGNPQSPTTPGATSGNDDAEGGAQRRRSASSALQQSPARAKALWEDPSATSRSRSAGRSGNAKRRTGKKSAGEKRSPRSSSSSATELPKAARALLQRVTEWDARLKSAAATPDPLAEPDAGAVPLQSAFRAACVDLLLSYPEAATKMDVARRLWQNWYRDLERVQRLESPSERDGLDECSRFYLDLVAQLEAKARNANLSADARQAVKLSLQHSLVALGDVERYKQPRLNASVGSSYAREAWSSAVAFYQRARTIAPDSGKVYNQLALVAARDEKFLEAAYMYARSLGCQHPFPARKNLLQSLKKGSQGLFSTNLLTQPDDHGVGMRTAEIMGKLHALLARSSDLRSWSEALPSAQAAVQALLNVEDLLGDKKYREQAATAVVQIVTVNLLLVYDTQSGDDQVKVTQDALDLDTGGQAVLCALDLLFSLGTSLLRQLLAFVQSSSDYRQLQDVASALLPGLVALLQWLHLHEWLPQARSDAAEQFYASCVKFHFALPSSKLAVYLVGLTAVCDQDLPEDLEAKGFLPLDFAREHYSSKFSSASAKSPAPKYTKGRHARARDGSPSTSTSKKLFQVRMARMVALCSQLSLSRGGGKLATVAHASVKESVGIDRLCSQCSNSSTFDDGLCEFCGFEDDTFETSADSEGDDDDDGCDGEVVLTAQYSRGLGLTSWDATSSHHAFNGAAEPYSSKVTTPQPSSPPNLDPSSFAAVMAIGSQYSEFQSGFQPSQTRSKCLIVIDAPNVAMRHGMNQQFSSLGVRLAAEYFRALGHRVVAFIPDYMLQSEEEQLAARRNQPRSANATLDSGSASVCKVPDDIGMLRTMVQEGVLVPTPPQDYDDSYCIQYAGLHDGCVVTNDLFRDHVLNMEGPRERKEAMRMWLKAHQISFTWVQNEFLPNPNFRFPA